MTCNDHQYENVCKDEFAQLTRKIDKLDDAIRGNGELGLKVRIDRLERAQATRNKLVWLITAAVITSSVSLLVQLVRGV
ncbi:hypothetical protein STSP2_01093 [Anaerohalosphaera lusitana]|uniref:Hemolysin XhlA n=1 Tax=Anaerohalosphaera lusitana TaxID=1936003 RepID=A0A1U9NJ45_9BACT|nr:hypothetical protein [Anaerohalosphaera lusitana]AQT67941.1 hypothetical protein STSP2_01093 [Anaerohalosphaera lusitana]